MLGIVGSMFFLFTNLGVWGESGADSWLYFDLILAVPSSRKILCFIVIVWF